MSSILLAALVFGCSFAGALMGNLLRARLPEHHRDDSSREVLKLVMGLIATMAALVLGLLISSAKSLYDTQQAEVQQQGIHLIQLDRVLARLGPDASEARSQLRRIVLAYINHTWPNDAVEAESYEPLQTDTEGEQLFERVAFCHRRRMLSGSIRAARCSFSLVYGRPIAFWTRRPGKLLLGPSSSSLCFGLRSSSLALAFSRASTQPSWLLSSLARSPSQAESS